MTETCSSLTFMTLYDPTLQDSGNFIPKNNDTSADSVLLQSGIYVGKPAPHIELCIGGSNLNYGPASGRILTRGAHVMVGYWDGFAAMVPESSKHGWFDTGDIGWIDDHGDLWLIGRIKDRIKSGGENVYPQEVWHENSKKKKKNPVSIASHLRKQWDLLIRCVHFQS